MSTGNRKVLDVLKGVSKQDSAIQGSQSSQWVLARGGGAQL